MDKEQFCAAKARLVAHMQEGQPWQAAAAAAGVQTSQSTAYRLLQVVRKQGEAALQDRRHGHPIKLRGEARIFLEDHCRQVPSTPSSVIHTLLQERFQPPREYQSDQQGRPLLVTTHRGDQHLTVGLPAIIAHYERAAVLSRLERVVVDREGMAAEFLAAVARRRTYGSHRVANRPVQRARVVPRGG